MERRHAKYGNFIVNSAGKVVPRATPIDDTGIDWEENVVEDDLSVVEEVNAENGFTLHDDDEYRLVRDVTVKPVAVERGDTIYVYFNPRDYAMKKAKAKARITLEALVHMNILASYDLKRVRGGIVRLFFNPLIQGQEQKLLAAEDFVNSLRGWRR
ncbi:hypothetical protein IKE98_03485 [Candidatus Saccharibacteria bacterium]|nr:hypothetical protein [Candidatus Saccharibacteria bacterium]